MISQDLLLVRPQGLGSGLLSLGKGYFNVGKFAAKLPVWLTKKGFGSGYKEVSDKTTGLIDKDIYIKGTDKPAILAKDIAEGNYRHQDGTVVTDYEHLDKPIYNKDGNIVISQEDLKRTYDSNWFTDWAHRCIYWSICL